MNIKMFLVLIISMFMGIFISRFLNQYDPLSSFNVCIIAGIIGGLIIQKWI